jgi:hypothetical protein
MPSTTTNRQIRYPGGADAANVPGDMQNLANDLDNVADVYTGTLAARPAATGSAGHAGGNPGSFYYAVDTDQLFLSYAAAWHEVPLSLIGTADIADAAITLAKIAASILTEAKFSTTLLQKLGLNDGAQVGRGKSIIATTESRTNAAYGLLTTPDRVQNIVLPTDGLIAVAFTGTWQWTVGGGAARAAIFVGANQLKATSNAGGAPGVQEIAGSNGVNVDESFTSSPGGLVGQSSQTGGAYPGDATTGQVVGLQFTTLPGGPCLIFAAAGTYDVSVQFKASSGSVTAKNRKLWVWTVGF